MKTKLLFASLLIHATQVHCAEHPCDVTSPTAATAAHKLSATLAREDIIAPLGGTALGAVAGLTAGAAAASRFGFGFRGVKVAALVSSALGAYLASKPTSYSTATTLPPLFINAVTEKFFTIPKMVLPDGVRWDVRNEGCEFVPVGKKLL